MQLSISKNKHRLNIYQLNKLKKYIKRLFIYYLNKNIYKLIPLENYIESIYLKKVNIKNILIKGIDTAYFEEQEDCFVFKLNNNLELIEIPAKLIDICKLINYGNLEVRGFPIFNIVFKHVIDNMEYYI